MGSEASVEVATPPSKPATHCACCGARIRRVIGERPLSISDAMALVAAAALAALIARDVLDNPLRGGPGWWRTLAIVVAGLVVLTPTVLILRLRRPRPPVRRLARHPGFAASVAATAMLALGALAVGLLAIVRVSLQDPLTPAAPHVWRPPPNPRWWLGAVLHFGAAVGPAVLAAWTLLALSGRRRPTTNGLDLLGRLIGAAWVVLFVIDCCARLAYLRV